MKSKLPEYLKCVQWFTQKRDLPRETSSGWCVLCRNKETKDEWFTFADFVLCRFDKVKCDFDEWRIIGAVAGQTFARGSKDNWFDVIAWTKVKPDEVPAYYCQKCLMPPHQCLCSHED